VEVRIARDPSSGAIAIEVCDDGPGFPTELLARPISLLGTSKSRGTGLGLYTAERLARGSRGTLVRENRPEGGARVHLRLPGGTPQLRSVPLEARGAHP
jgi:signal transduction histidine kinase